MSQTTSTTAPTLQRDAELNAMILEGRILDAFDRFYADEIVMQENTAPATAGKAANRAREEQFVGSVEALHEIKLVSTGAGPDGTTYGVWVIDASYKGAGRVRSEQVAVRTWKDGAVVREQFFHA
ncbi:MAG TPA: SnoaL-like domain-containing protein [Kofleriaceae bacterium]|nr:SnoaL-like domain-containing protein [Kofleriaceae bacterium]